MAMMFTAKLMLEWLGEQQDADRLDRALAQVIAEGTIATYDIKGRGNGDSTMAVAEEVARKVTQTVGA